MFWFAQMVLLIAAVFPAAALEFPLEGLQLNDRLRLREVSPMVRTSAGFHARYSGDNIDIDVQGLSLADETASRRKGAVELAGLRNLYKPHGNPYEGQVSDLIQCTKELMPKSEMLKLPSGGTAELLVGGATGRKMFGACARDQIEYWGGFFQFYLEPAKTSVSVRMFLKNRPGLTPEKARDLLKSVGEGLLVKAPTK